jgi:hypothetical protein
MRAAWVGILILLLSGCAGYQEAMQRAEAQRQVDLDRKAEALQTGTSLANLKMVWGEPTTSTFTQQGDATIQTLQYGRCARSAYATTGVLFVTVVNGKVLRYSIIQC